MNREELLQQTLRSMIDYQASVVSDLNQALAILEDSVPQVRETFLAILETAGVEEKEQLRRCVGFLQFDDIVQQLLKALRSRSEELETLGNNINDLATTSAAIDQEIADRLLSSLAALAINHENERSIDQNNMDTGEIELF